MPIAVFDAPPPPPEYGAYDRGVLGGGGALGEGGGGGAGGDGGGGAVGGGSGGGGGDGGGCGAVPVARPDAVALPVAPPGPT